MKTVFHILLAFSPLFLQLGCYNDNNPTGSTSKEKESDNFPKAIDFTLLDADGNSHTLRQYQGKVVVLHFFATQCKSYEMEIARLKTQVCEAYKDRGLCVIGISLHENPQLVKEFAATYKVTYPLPIDTKGDVYKAYGVTATPHYVIIDKGQNIRYARTGYDETKINTLLAMAEHLTSPQALSDPLSRKDWWSDLKKMFR